MEERLLDGRGPHIDARLGSGCFFNEEVGSGGSYIVGIDGRDIDNGQRVDSELVNGKTAAGEIEILLSEDGRAVGDELGFVGLRLIVIDADAAAEDPA